MKNIIKIGTRKSKLALIQTDIVKDKIKQAFPELEVEIVKIDTKGDQILDKSLTSALSRTAPIPKPSGKSIGISFAL